MGRKKVVVAGGGMAGSLMAKLLEMDADVTLIDSKEYFELRWATLRCFVEPSIADKIVIPHLEYLNRAKLVVGTLRQATASEVHVVEDEGPEGGVTAVPYDYLIIATGSSPQPPIPFQDRIKFYRQQNNKLKAAESILVVGGGPVGVEFAAEIATDFPEKKVRIVHNGDRLLDFLAPKASALALRWLQQKKVDVVFDEQVIIDPGYKTGQQGVFITFSGKAYEADYLFIADSSRPDLTWLKDTFKESIHNNRLLKVDQFLRVEGHKNVFAAGDITNCAEAKQGVAAQEHARRIAFNLKKIMHEKPKEDPSKLEEQLKAYVPGPHIAIVSLGRNNGLAQTQFNTFTGLWPTMTKSKGLMIEKVRTELQVTWQPTGFNMGVHIKDMIFSKRIMPARSILDETG